MEASEAAAVEQARAGDQDAYRVLVERHSRGLFRLAYRMTGNEQDAEDVVRETFLRAYRQMGRFDSRCGFGTWLCRIAVICSLDLLRARQRRRETGDATAQDNWLPADQPAPDRLAFSSQVRQRVAAALDELSPAERTAFVLRHFEGVSIEEISRALGCRNGAARHSVFRAVAKLRRALEPVAGWK